MKLVRCSSYIDLDNILSLGSAGAILIYLRRQRSLVSPSSNSSPGYMSDVRSVTLFNLSDYVSISEESRLSLQIINRESHPKNPALSVNSKGSVEKENLSVYGLFHPLASTRQGQAHLRHMFLRPTSNLHILSQRQQTIALFLQPSNKEKQKRATAILQKMGNVAHAISHLRKGISSPSPHKAFNISV
ncbi:hypothetical protein ACQKWADRAFT_193635 [Trichoderma austrokoningii]